MRFTPYSRRALAAGVALVFALAGSASAQNQPSFQGIGDLSGGAFESVAQAVSADGSAVVGSSVSGNGQEAFRWTVSGGFLPLGDLAGGAFFSFANAISADGLVAAGTGSIASDGSRAVRWTFDGAGNLISTQTLGNFSCAIVCPDVAIGAGISPTGAVVVGAGTDRPLFGDPFVEAGRWTGTSISGLGHLSGGGTVSTANDASPGGAIIVGDSDSTNGNRGFWWDGSIHALAAINGSEPNSSGMAISTDGSTIVGFANTAPSGTQTIEAVRWTGASYATIEVLGAIPGATLPGSRAKGVTGDGSIIVGTANDATSQDVAFIWDAVGGMRSLKVELEDEYGLDLTGWTLVQATGISDVNGAGEVTIVGTGTNPSGDPEGWVAVLSATDCNDGADNDSDTLVDFPADPECLAKGDRSETENCSDGLDNDGDGDIDWPADAECLSSLDLSEEPDCADAIDNDGDGQVDFPADPGCRSALTLDEEPDCDDGIDNDNDTLVDYPADPGCLAADDLIEFADCADGLDNDGDGSIDLVDPDCVAVTDPSEDPACSDRVDNDGDHALDWPAAYPSCTSAADATELPQCIDGEDNDGDGGIDDLDSDCDVPQRRREDPVDLDPGDLLVVDEAGQRLFAIDPATGTQTLISEGAQLTAPQGVAVRATGEIVVADPTGLYEIDGSTGAQRRFSDAVSAFDSLQVAVDSAGDPFVLEADRIGRVSWTYGGIGATATVLAIPTPELPFPTLLFWQGDSLTREASGSLLATGFGNGNDGVFRIDPVTEVVTSITPGFSSDFWSDLAVEASGQILAAGVEFPVNPGVFRIDPGTGVDTPLADGPEWIEPTAVAIGSAGAVFVADAGTCAMGACTGGSVVEVDSVSGARIHVWTGGHIAGQMDLAVVGALPACSDGVDNDSDSATDFPADAGCPGPGAPSELPECADGLDNDGDGGVDLADNGCFDALEASRENPSTECNDGIDNDFDNLVDWDGGASGSPDPNCFGTPWNIREKKPKKRCGLGFEVVGLAALLGPVSRARRRRP